MQESFEVIYDKIAEQLKKEIYYSDINELIKEYEVITINDIIIDDDFINIDELGESQLMTIDHQINNNMIIFDVNQYLEKIFKSYKYNPERINCQFNMDFKRSQLILNKKRLSYDMITNEIKQFSKYKIKIDGKELTMDIVIIALCTQASFAFPFMLVSKLYNKENINVVSNNNKYIVHYNKHSLNIKLEVNLNIKNIKNNQVLSKLNVITNIDGIIKNNKFELCKYAIMSWNNEQLN